MIVKTKIFELCDDKYKNLSELAYVMGISVSQIYRVREGTRNINQKFIVGAVKAFPGYTFDELFYFAAGSPSDNMLATTVVSNYRRRSSARSKRQLYAAYPFSIDNQWEDPPFR